MGIRAATLAAGATIAFALGTADARAAISFQAQSGNAPVLFGSGMVLQRGGPVPVWGTADASTPVHADFVEPGSGVLQSRSTTSTTDGRFVLRFDGLPVGGPYELHFFEGAEASPSVVLTDVLVGDVWLLSGQSNMALRGPLDGDAAFYPRVRALTTSAWGQKPSGAAFYFGAQLNDFLGIPIGLVNRAQADTALGHWLPPEVASDSDPVVQSLFTGCGGMPVNRCHFYEQHIRPLERPVSSGEPAEGMALRGIVWWQGEKGADKQGTAAYEHLFPAMIRAWRANLGQDDLPVVFHQLPSGTGLRWNDYRVKRLPSTNRLTHWQPLQRRMFFRMLEYPSTSLMSSIDLEPGTHPAEIDLYGRRLGDAALGTTYASEVAPYAYSGPIYESAELEETAGADEVRITFRANTANGLQIGPGTDPPTTVLQGFAVCCDVDGLFVFADARIENDDEVVVSHPSVATPTAVHYGLGRNPRWANLFNGDQRGAAPFSTEPSAIASSDPDADGFWEPGPYTELP